MPESPLIKKLMIKPNYRIALVNAPEGYRDVLGELPAGAEITDTLTGEFDLIHAFFIKSAEVAAQAETLKTHLKNGGLLWLSYPKAGRLGTDLKRDPLYALMKNYGLEAVAQIAINDDWSAMRFKVVE